MKTCKHCTEFDAKTETCGCPLNAYPNAYTYEYTYARTAAESQVCMFFAPTRKIPVED